MKYIFLFFILNLICFGILAVLTDKLPLFAPEQLQFLEETYGIDNNEEFSEFFSEMKSQGLLLEVVNRQNLEILSLVAFANLFTLLTTIHLLVDKLFFKTVAQSPSIRTAVRRAFLLTIIIVGFIALRLYNLLEWYIVLFVLVLFFFIEYTIYRYSQSKIIESNEIQRTSSKK